MMMATTGLIRLKKQNGRYVSVGTPKTLACVAPPEFHGTSTEVNVPESSRVLLRSSGLNPLSLNVLEYILPGTTMAIYWSEAVRLKNMHVATVVAMSEPVE